MATGSVTSFQHPKLQSGSMFGEPSSTILPPTTPTNLNHPFLNPETHNLDFPCLPSNSNPTLSTTHKNPNLNSHSQVPESVPLPPSPNPWKKPPNLRKILTTKKFILRFIPPSSRGSDLIGICPSEAVVGELQILDLTLVGFFLGRKPAFSHIRSTLLKQWKIRGSVRMLQLTQGGLAFRFSDIEDRDQILETGVFYVSGQPIFFRSWERNIHTGGILGLKQIPLWVSLPGLPLHLWGQDSLSAVCSVLGKPLYSDRITAEKSRWSFARACVEFSAGSPLLDSITIEDDVGNIFQQPVKYDWKPPHCITCGIFGHIMDSCKGGPGGDAQENEEVFETTNQTHTHPKEASPTQANEKKSSATEQGMEKNANLDLSNLGKGKTFSELLQKRTSMLLRGWQPIRVKKTGSSVQDPTRIRNSFQFQNQKSDLVQPAEHVSSDGASSCGPTPFCMEEGAQTQPSSSPPLLGKNSNFKLPAQSIPPTTNRFGILEFDVDTFPCPHPIDKSLSDCGTDQAVVHPACSTFGSTDLPCEELNHDVDLPSQKDKLHSNEGREPGNVSRAGLWQAGVFGPNLGPGNPSSEGCKMNRTGVCKPTTYCSSHHNVNRPRQSPASPKPGISLPPNGNASSSAGRTPYPSRYSKVTSPYQSYSDLVNPSRSMFCLASNSEDSDHRRESITFADATDEDVEDNIDDEENGLKEYENENEDSAEEVDDQNRKDKEDEDTARRKRWSTAEFDGDPWVVSTSWNDPRRIRIC